MKQKIENRHMKMTLSEFMQAIVVPSGINAAKFILHLFTEYKKEHNK